jgi:putative glutamine amidotransferase
MDDHPPSILVSVAIASRQPDPAMALRRIGLYAEAVRRAGGEPVLIDATAGADERRAAFETMDGLLLAGGADVHPARYGQVVDGARDMEPERDELEAAAWGAAEIRGRPVLGICRGFQAMNVFAGGSLVQHLDGHEGPGWGLGSAARTHPIRLVPGTRLAGLLGDDEGAIDVNTYHHQGVTAAGLAPGLVASAWSGDLVEGLEADGHRFVLGVQCHPERTDSTPSSFGRLFRGFMEAASAER